MPVIHEREISDCDTVYRTGSGGYWRALAALLLAGVSTVGLVILLSGETTMDHMLIALLFLGPFVLFLVLYALVSFMVNRNSLVGTCDDGILVQSWTGHRRFIKWEDITALVQMTTWGVWNNRHRLLVQTGKDSPLLRVRIGGSRQGAEAESLGEWRQLREALIERCDFQQVSERKMAKEFGEKSETIIDRKMWAPQ
ncbi:MAG: hypothetical protein R6V19_13795 [Armatimonadota bacterium]